ncbi:MAG: CDP-alcohol phosphatidyltransferase family protein [Sporichthyaceae bacterium]|nr:CDP-alcohol phosphatidyltransferase family protein [Sporichthyaceae bacterium]
MTALGRPDPKPPEVPGAPESPVGVHVGGSAGRPGSSAPPATSATPGAPSVAELRAVCQPASTLTRRNGEHWAGRLYARRLSIYLTRFWLRLGWSADRVTWLMVGIGMLGALAPLLPGLVGGLACLVLIQAYLVLDCSDGEVARWNGHQSAHGIYLDRLGHYLTEAALLAAVGFRASALGADGWAVIGLLAALGAVLIKAETDLVDAARARAGLGPVTDAAAQPVSRLLGRARQIAGAAGLHRIIGAVEASVLVAVAAVVDAARGDLVGTRSLIVVFALVAGHQLVLHLVSVLVSRRLI